MADSLAEDEAKLAGYASRLMEVAEQVLPTWVERAVISRTSVERFETDSLLFVATHQAQVDAARTVMPKLRVLLRLDIDRQRSTPLEVIRKAVPFPSRVLQLAGVPEVERDEFATRQLPTDVYDLTPMSLAAVHEDLHMPGLEWGAAKAHVHLRRRREAGAGEAIRAAAYAPNLMDRGRIMSGLPSPLWLNNEQELADTDADLVVVDLTRVKDISILEDLDGWIVGYGPHVDSELFEKASAAGCDEVLARSVFFKRLAQGQITVRRP